MSISAPPAPAGTTDGPGDVAARLPAAIRPYVNHLRAFYHALPGLIAAGDEGRYALVRADGVHGVWDTRRDAAQRGYELFPDGGFLRQKVEPRMLPYLADLFGDRPGAG
jgi:hypothetical protein